MALTMVKPDEMEAQAGTKLPPGEWFEIDQERINTFADCTEDHQFIHIDEAAAAQTPFGGTIAHGFLTLSLMTKLCAENGVYPYWGSHSARSPVVSVDSSDLLTACPERILDDDYILFIDDAVCCYRHG